MSRRLILACLCAAGAVFAASPAPSAKVGESKPLYWKVEEEEDKRYAVGIGAFQGLRTQLHWGMGEVKLLEWKDSPTDPKVGVLIYLSGASGTGPRLTITERALIVNSATKKVIGDEIWRTAENEKGKAKFFPEAEQPKWKWKANSLEVEFPQLGDVKRYEW